MAVLQHVSLKSLAKMLEFAYTTEEMPYKDDQSFLPVIVGVEALESMGFASSVQDRKIRDFRKIRSRGRLAGNIYIAIRIASRPLVGLCNDCHTA